MGAAKTSRRGRRKDPGLAEARREQILSAAAAIFARDGALSRGLRR